MKLSQAEIILNSKINTNRYYLFNDKIIVESGDGSHNNINLPLSDNIICFYDMYYEENELKIVIATRDSYDLICVLNESDLNMQTTKLTK